MANVTDPLVAAVHGTDPQNLMEYITRQKIYDSRYWKEECFGLTAVDVLEKASHIKTIGGSYGGNMQPTKFLCLTLKMLQIQPDDELVDELVANEDFKYVRALGAFYKRLSGRPADIYQALEPLYRDFRKLKYRQITEWSLIHMDEFIHSLLTEERVCGIALPRLPQRSVLVEAGYLEDTRPTALAQVLDDGGPQAYLLKKVQQGSAAAKALYEHRRRQRAQKEQEQLKEQSVEDRNHGEKRPRAVDHESNRHSVRHSNGNSQHDMEHDTVTSRHSRDRDYERAHGDAGYRRSDQRGYGVADSSLPQRHRDRKDNNKGEGKRYGSLFKTDKAKNTQIVECASESKQPDEGSDEYWNEQRAKLGLKPLK